MQVNPFYPRHVQTKECQVGAERRKQRETAISSALALRQQFTVRGDVLERVEVFKYLGRMLAQDDDDIQAVRAQLRKARAVWARVGQVLDIRVITCRRCGKQMQHSLLNCHLADVHDIYQQVVVAKELLEEQDSETYVAKSSYTRQELSLPIPWMIGSTQQQLDDATYFL
jgi:hypothetical protein